MQGLPSFAAVPPSGRSTPPLPARALNMGVASPSFPVLQLYDMLHLRRSTDQIAVPIRKPKTTMWALLVSLPRQQPHKSSLPILPSSLRFHGLGL